MMNTEAMIIDAHVHFWNYDKKRDAWMDAMPVLQQDHLPAGLENILFQNGVAACVAVQAAQSESETLFLSELAEKNPFIKGVVGWVDLRNINIEERLEYFSARPVIKGWRHICQGEAAGFLLREDFLYGIKALEAYGYTYDVLIGRHQLEETLKFVTRFPGQKFVVDHCAKPAVATGEIKDWAVWMKELARHPGVYCKFSGLLTEARWHNWKVADIYPYFDTVVEAFGCRRILFGSDWPVLNAAGNYKQWKDLLLQYLSSFSQQEQQHILCNNTIEFYSL